MDQGNASSVPLIQIPTPPSASDELLPSESSLQFTQQYAIPMKQAIKRKDFRAIKSFLASGFDPAFPLTEVTLMQDKWNVYLLLSAAGNSHIVKDLIISHKVDVNYRDTDGFTALMIAADKGDKEMVKTLLEMGCQSDLLFEDKLSAKDLAIQAGHLEVAKLLRTESQNALDHNQI